MSQRQKTRFDALEAAIWHGIRLRCGHRIVRLSGPFTIPSQVRI